MPDNEIYIWNYFPGGVPAGTIFKYNCNQLKDLLNRNKPTEFGQTLEELCFLGLVSYFEAFCKDNFASLINICPDLILRLKKNNYDVSIESITALKMEENFNTRIGSLLAEKYDFGPAQKINTLYKTILTVTPFSKEESLKYSKILSDRNLLVHHGGTYTSKYLSQQKIISIKAEAFFGSLVVTREYLLEKIALLETVAFKTIKSCKESLLNDHLNEKISEVGIKALELLDEWPENNKNG